MAEWLDGNWCVDWSTRFLIIGQLCLSDLFIKEFSNPHCLIVEKVLLFHNFLSDNYFVINISLSYSIICLYQLNFLHLLRQDTFLNSWRKKCALLLQNISKSLHRGKWCSADHLISPSAKLFGRPLYFFNSISWIWSKYLSKVIKSISPSDQLDAPTCLAITHLISWSAPREQHLIVQEWHMLISPYICPPVLLVCNQSYSWRVEKILYVFRCPPAISPNCTAYERLNHVPYNSAR